MTVYIIGYDLRKAGQDYKSLHEQIRSYGTYLHFLDSTWIIRTAQTAAQVRNHLQGYIDGNDKIFVAELAGHAAWSGFTTGEDDWIKDVLTNRG